MISTAETSRGRTESPTLPIDDPTVNLWACLGADTDRLLAAHGLTGISLPALLQLGAAEALDAPDVRNFIEAGDLSTPEAVAVAVSIVELGGQLDTMPQWAYDDEQLRHARQAIATASSLLPHDTERRAQPASWIAPTLQAVVDLVDRRTQRQHAVLLALIVLIVEHDLLDGRLPSIIAGPDGTLSCAGLEAVSYRHPGVRGSDASAGITIGRILLDVPDYDSQSQSECWLRLRQRAGVTRPIAIFHPAEVMQYGDEIVAELRSSLTGP